MIKREMCIYKRNKMRRSESEECRVSIRCRPRLMETFDDTRLNYIKVEI